MTESRSSAKVIGLAAVEKAERFDDKLPSTSVVMPTYNRRSRLREVVLPLLRDPFPQEIVVVVDGSEDGSMELLEQLAWDDDRLRPLWIPNAGEMEARGAGAAHASGEVLVVLDDDVQISPGLLRKHAAWHAVAERLVVLGYMPITLPAERVRDGFATRLYAREYERACASYEANPESILHRLWAGNISLRRIDALKVGFPNAAYCARYHQDREFGLRCLRQGMVGVFDRRLRAEHLHSRSLTSFKRDARAQGEGAALLRRIHGDLLGPRTVRGQAASATVAAVARDSIIRLAPYRVATLSLVAALRTASKLRLSWLESAAARLLRLLERRQGELLIADTSKNRTSLP